MLSFFNRNEDKTVKIMAMDRSSMGGTGDITQPCIVEVEDSNE